MKNKHIIESFVFSRFVYFSPLSGGKETNASSTDIQNQSVSSAPRNVFTENPQILFENALSQIKRARDSAIQYINNSTENKEQNNDATKNEIENGYENALNENKEAMKELSLQEQAVLKATLLFDNIQNVFKTAYNSLVVLQTSQQRLFRLSTHSANGNLNQNAMTSDGANKVMVFNNANKAFLNEKSQSIPKLKELTQDLNGLSVQYNIPFISDLVQKTAIINTQLDDAFNMAQNTQNLCDTLCEGLRLVYIEGPANNNHGTVILGERKILEAKNGRNDYRISTTVPTPASITGRV